MKKMNVYTICFEGLDKSGKSNLATYLRVFGKYTLNILDRGPITNIVWNKIQYTDIEYNLEMWKNTLFVMLNVDEEDWKIRCKIHNEPEMPLSFHKMTKAYHDMFSVFKNNGFHVVEYNTSKMTQYEISKSIIDILDKLNSNIEI